MRWSPAGHLNLWHESPAKYHTFNVQKLSKEFHNTVRHLHDTGRDDPAYDLRQPASPSNTWLLLGWHRGATALQQFAKQEWWGPIVYSGSLFSWRNWAILTGLLILTTNEEHFSKQLECLQNADCEYVTVTVTVTFWFQCFCLKGIRLRYLHYQF